MTCSTSWPGVAVTCMLFHNQIDNPLIGLYKSFYIYFLCVELILISYRRVIIMAYKNLIAKHLSHEKQEL